MENSNLIVPPHLNAEVYRNFNSHTNTASFLDYMYINSDGAVLIGSSELTGRQWNGEATVYKSISEALEQKRDNTKSIYLTSGTADGCFIEKSYKLILCEDSGSVSVWSKSDGQHAWHEWTEEASVAEHDDTALAIDCLTPEKEYITAGADGNIKVWDVNMMICMRNYASAHSAAIYDISVQPQSNSKFASGSMDQYFTLWDDNIDKPAMELYVNDCCIRCLEWYSENQLIFGDEAGMIKLVDIRNTEEVIKLAQFPAAVHRMSFHPDTKRLAVSCDNKIASVCEIAEDTSCILVYYDEIHMHKHFVRGIAWDVEDKNLLHTTGWDGQVKTHRIE